jgi:hypothetical protein
MDTWAEQAVRELEVDLRRLDLDAEAKRVALERAQADYDAVIAEQATVRGMLDWARKRRSQQAAEPAPAILDSAMAAADAGSTAVPLLGVISAGAPVAGQAVEAEPPAQTELCVNVLTQLGRPADTAEVRRSLEQAGYPFSQTQVRSALKYLAGKKKPPVESVRPGVWQLTGAGAFVPAGSESVLAMNGTGGSP